MSRRGHRFFLLVAEYFFDKMLDGRKECAESHVEQMPDAERHGDLDIGLHALARKIGDDVNVTLLGEREVFDLLEKGEQKIDGLRNSTVGNGRGGCIARSHADLQTGNVDASP